MKPSIINKGIVNNKYKLKQVYEKNWFDVNSFQKQDAKIKTLALSRPNFQKKTSIPYSKLLNWIQSNVKNQTTRNLLFYRYILLYFYKYFSAQNYLNFYDKFGSLNKKKKDKFENNFASFQGQKFVFFEKFPSLMCLMIDLYFCLSQQMVNSHIFHNFRSNKFYLNTQTLKSHTCQILLFLFYFKQQKRQNFSVALRASNFKETKNSFSTKNKNLFSPTLFFDSFKRRQVLKSRTLKLCLNSFCESQNSITNSLFSSRHKIQDCILFLEKQLQEAPKFILKAESTEKIVYNLENQKKVNTWFENSLFQFSKDISLWEWSSPYGPLDPWQSPIAYGPFHPWQSPIAYGPLHPWQSLIAYGPLDPWFSVSSTNILRNNVSNVCLITKTAFFSSVEKKHFYEYFRESSNKLTLLNAPFKSKNALVLFENSFLYLTTTYDSISQILKTLKLQDNNLWSDLQISHSCFSLFEQKAGLEFKGFYLSQRRLTLKKMSNQANLFVPDLKLSTQITNSALKNLGPCRDLIFKFQFLQNLRNLKIVYSTHLFKTLQNPLLSETKIQILPSPVYLMNYLNKLKKIIVKEKASSQKKLIEKLEPHISDWCNYYAIVSNKKSFFFCDYMLFTWLWRWACRRHSNKSRIWIQKKYFQKLRSSQKFLSLRFCSFNTVLDSFNCLPEHKQIILKRHLFAQNRNWKYWYSLKSFH